VGRGVAWRPFFSSWPGKMKKMNNASGNGVVFAFKINFALIYSLIK